MGAIPQYQVQIGEPDAVDRTVYFFLTEVTDYIEPVIAFGAPKANISIAGAATAMSTNSIAQVSAAGAPGVAELELAVTEVAALQDMILTVSNGKAFGQCVVEVVNFDPNAEGAASDSALRQRMGVPH